MGDIKPLGSEKLQGNEKIKRILELTYYNDAKKSASNNKPETVKESVSGVYGIVREKDGYYVKKGLNENSLEYIGGLFMKNKNRFSSYGDALKRMDLLSGQENLQEATKYVLKQKSTEQEAPIEQPSMNEVPPTDVPSDTAPIDTPSTDPTSDNSSSSDDSSTVTPGDDESTGKRSDYMAEIQKYAGKLGQQLRDEHERMESDDIKYVLNMIISAVDLDKLDDEDIDDISKKFERNNENSSDDSGSDDNLSNDSKSLEVPSDNDSELGENMTKLNNFINSPAISQQDEIDLSKYADLGNVDETKEIDMDEIKHEINQRIGETLSKYFK